MHSTSYYPDRFLQRVDTAHPAADEKVISKSISSSATERASNDSFLASDGSESADPACPAAAGSAEAARTASGPAFCSPERAEGHWVQADHAVSMKN